MILEKIMDDVFLIKNNVFSDSRGHFIELFNKEVFKEIGVNDKFIQDNLSLSKKKGTIRGLHYQKPPFEQSKYVSLLNGSIEDVFIDVRPDSKNFGKYNSVILDKPGDSIYIPKGYLHGFCTLQDDTIVEYKVDNFYNKDSEIGVLWNDKSLLIDWKLSNINPILSHKDSNLMSWSQFIKDMGIK